MKLLKPIVVIVFFAFLVASCVKSLEDEGVFDSTILTGTVVERQRNIAVPCIRVTLTNGDNISHVVLTDDEGSFTISVSAEELSHGYYLRFDADSLYSPMHVSLDEVGFGVKSFSFGTIYIDGPHLPDVESDSVTSVSPTRARLYGATHSDGKTAITQCGFCWSEQQYPTLDNSYVAVSRGVGTFDAIVEGLRPATTYFVRAYAINGLGISFGRQLSFTTPDGLPSVVATEVTEVTPLGALCGGSVVDDGGFLVTARGVCYSTTPMPIIANSHTSNGQGLGPFVAQLGGLHPSTTYYVRAYATNLCGTVYSDECRFTTLSGAPEVQTMPASEISTTSAEAGGMVTDDGGFPIIARGVCFSTTPQPTIASPCTTDGADLGAFVSHLSNLQPSTTYYYRAYATNAVTTSYGAEYHFTTMAW